MFLVDHDPPEYDHYGYVKQDQEQDADEVPNEALRQVEDIVSCCHAEVSLVKIVNEFVVVFVGLYFVFEELEAVERDDEQDYKQRGQFIVGHGAFIDRQRDGDQAVQLGDQFKDYGAKGAHIDEVFVEDKLEYVTQVGGVELANFAAEYRVEGLSKFQNMFFRKQIHYKEMTHRDFITTKPRNLIIFGKKIFLIFFLAGFGHFLDHTSQIKINFPFNRLLYYLTLTKTF